MTKNLRVVFSDQLSRGLASLQGYQDGDVIFFVETMQEFTHVKHHKKKIILLLSAMRHFAEELKGIGYKINYIKIEDKDNSQLINDEISKAVKKYKISKIIVTHPSEYHMLEMVNSWQQMFNLPLQILDDDRFLCNIEKFKIWASEQKQLRMEFFYRIMRKKYSILMDKDKPIGGKWNYDSENRKFPKGKLDIPKTYSQKNDVITEEVIEIVDKLFSSHFGSGKGFNFAVTREGALKSLELFIKQRLPYFGDFQDAMVQGEPWMYHSHISFYLNCGLLTAKECITTAEKAYRDNAAPLNAVEGFIRQILGWREYIRAIYWAKMPGYTEENYFGATRNLPEFYWSADTKMNCIKQCVKQTSEHAYAHHIQRLMVLGNFALLAAIEPKQVNEWFWIVYADAFEWVELPNVSGMVLFADGGYLASKPYAAGGSYINKMSDYCRNCEYKVAEKTGKKACPFNYLYWDFLVRNRDKLQKNHRIGMMYRTYDKMPEEKKQKIAEDSNSFLKDL